MKRRPERRRHSLQPVASPEGSFTRRRTAPLLETTTEEDDTLTDTCPKQTYRVVVMGSAKVGKTAIISQFLYDSFKAKYVRTVEDLHVGEYEVQGRTLNLEILDTSGSYQFPAMRRLSISTADGFVLVFSCNDTDSFEKVKELREEILETKYPGAPIVVVANKCDLDETEGSQVAKLQDLVESEWTNGFVETSAKESINIVQVFKELLSQAKVRYDLSPAVERRRQSLPVSPHLSAGQLQHLQNISRRNNKRSSCVVS